MNKVVINTCYGGFGLSFEAMDMLYQRKNPGKKLYLYTAKPDEDFELWVYTKINNPDQDPESRVFTAVSEDFGDTVKRGMCDKDKFSKCIVYGSDFYPSRHDKDLVKVVETLGSEKASGEYAELSVVNLKKNNKYRIHEHDGLESVEVYPGKGWITIE